MYRYLFLITLLTSPFILGESEAPEKLDPIDADMLADMPQFSAQDYAAGIAEYRKKSKYFFTSRYLEAQKENPAYLLQYAIFHGFSEEKLNSLIMRHIPDKNFVLQAEHTNRGVGSRNTSALQLAVALNDSIALDYVLHLNPNVNYADNRGYTALHFAALHQDKTFYNVLVDLNANEAAQNNYHGTAKDLYTLTHLDDPKEQQIWMKSEVGDIKKSKKKIFDGLEFFVRTGATYITETKAKPAEIIKLWASKHKMSEESQNSSYRQNKDTVLLGHVIRKPLDPFEAESIEYGLFACQDIGINMAIGPMAGLWTFKEGTTLDPEHRILNTDGQYFRSMPMLAADSFPNAKIISVTDRAGLPQREQLVAQKKIEQGDLITIDWGDHVVKWAQHKELNPEIDDFISSLTEERLRVFRDYNFKTTFQRQMTYIINTPTAFLQFALMRPNGPKEALNILASPACYRNEICTFNKVDFVNLFELLEENAPFRKVATKFLLKKAQQGKTLAIMELLRSLSQTDQNELVMSPPIIMSFLLKLKWGDAIKRVLQRA